MRTVRAHAVCVCVINSPLPGRVLTRRLINTFKINYIGGCLQRCSVSNSGNSVIAFPVAPLSCTAFLRDPGGGGNDAAE